MGFAHVAAWAESESDGRSWLSFFRKVPASAARGAAIAAGASAGALDGMAGAAAGTATNVVTLRQRQGRRDDRDLMVSGWR